MQSTRKRFSPLARKVVNIRTQREQIDDSMRMERTFAALTTGFGALALALACVGVFGVMAYSVAKRTNEIGIRMALGAQPGQVKGTILCESTLLAAVGISGGIAGVLLLSRLVIHALRDPTLRSGIDGSRHSYPAGGCPSRKLDSSASSSWSAANGSSQTRVTVNRKSSLQLLPTGQRGHPDGLKVKIAGSGSDGRRCRSNIATPVQQRLLRTSRERRFWKLRLDSKPSPANFPQMGAGSSEDGRLATTDHTSCTEQHVWGSRLSEKQDGLNE
jgi:hypothetical protein